MNQEKELLDKIIDYKNFTMVLLAVAVLLNAGISLKGFELAEKKLWFVLAVQFTCMLFAFLFMILHVKWTKKLIDRGNRRH